jgi:hypothetical protein
VTGDLTLPSKWGCEKTQEKVQIPNKKYNKKRNKKEMAANFRGKKAQIQQDDEVRYLYSYKAKL